MSETGGLRNIVSHDLKVFEAKQVLALWRKGLWTADLLTAEQWSGI